MESVDSRIQALEESITLWEEIVNKNLDYKPTWAVEKYACGCPLCEYTGGECEVCPVDWSDIESACPCLNSDSAYLIWSENRTKENAIAVLNLLKSAYVNEKCEEQYCKKCGQSFGVHNSDGSCVEDETITLTSLEDIISYRREKEQETFSIKDENLIRILIEIRDNFNDLVISEPEKIEKLIGFQDDGDDYYYILKSIRGVISYQSCVGRIIPIKGRIDKKDYEYLNSCFVLNGETK